MVDLGPLGDTNTHPHAVNDSGQVVGSPSSPLSPPAFSWTASGGMVDLGTLGGTGSSAPAVNSVGQVVGSASTTTIPRVQTACRAVGGLGVARRRVPGGAGGHDRGIPDALTCSCGAATTSLWHKGLTGPWSGWEPLGAPPGGLASDPAAVAWSAGRIDVFAAGADGHLWHNGTPAVVRVGEPRRRRRGRPRGVIVGARPPRRVRARHRQPPVPHGIPGRLVRMGAARRSPDLGTSCGVVEFRSHRRVRPRHRQRRLAHLLRRRVERVRVARRGARGQPRV